MPDIYKQMSALLKCLSSRSGAHFKWRFHLTPHRLALIIEEPGNTDFRIVGYRDHGLFVPMYGAQLMEDLDVSEEDKSFLFSFLGVWGHKKGRDFITKTCEENGPSEVVLGSSPDTLYSTDPTTAFTIFNVVPRGIYLLETGRAVGIPAALLNMVMPQGFDAPVMDVIGIDPERLNYVRKLRRGLKSVKWGS